MVTIVSEDIIDRWAERVTKFFRECEFGSTNTESKLRSRIWDCIKKLEEDKNKDKIVDCGEIYSIVVDKNGSIEIEI